MRIAFHSWLAALDHAVVDLCGDVRRAAMEATQATLREDLAIAEDVMGSLVDIRDSSSSIRARAEALMARQQPVAQDLRHLLEAQRQAASLEQMGALAGAIARLARRRYPRTVVPHEVRGVVVDMAAVLERLTDMLGESLAARRVTHPAVLNDLHHQMDHLAQEMQAIVRSPAWPHSAATAIDMSALGRDLHDLADHVLDIAAGLAYVDGDHF